MNNFLNQMERKFGKYAIKNLTIYIIGLYIIGYVLQLAPASVNITSFLTLNPYLILHGQIWRLITWIIIPPTSFSILIIFTLYLYYFMGTTMERTVGTFRYNVFLFTGFLLMIIAAFVTYGVYYVLTGGNADAIALLLQFNSTAFSTYYIQQAVFLAFALSYPDVQLLLMFFIPVKVKWLGIVYAVIMVYEAFSRGIQGQLYGFLFSILFQFINLGIFYLQTGKLSHMRPKEVKRRHDFKKNAKIMPKGVTRHKCAVCGRTEATNPELEFRFCSKCNGNYEYCQDHLFTHQHVK